VLEQLRFAEVHHLVPVVNLDQPYNYYHDKDHGTNVWENYFEPVKGMTSAELDNSDPKTITFVRPEEQWVFYPQVANLDLQDQKQRAYKRSEGARLTAKYIQPGPQVQWAVNDFYKRHMHGQTVLGMHVSGVDNYVRFEGKRVPFGRVIPLDEYAPYIETFLTQYPDGKLLVITDKDELRTAVVKKYGDRIIQVNMEKTSLSRTGRGYQLGVEALTGALLLSKCDFFIRGWSSIAEVATYFNLSIPVIDLSYLQNIDDIECFFQIKGTTNHQPLKK
jgi:hypothetical protein